MALPRPDSAVGFPDDQQDLIVDEDLRARLIRWVKVCEDNNPKLSRHITYWKDLAHDLHIAFIHLPFKHMEDPVWIAQSDSLLAEGRFAREAAEAYEVALTANVHLYAAIYSALNDEPLFFIPPKVSQALADLRTAMRPVIEIYRPASDRTVALDDELQEAIRLKALQPRVPSIPAQIFQSITDAVERKIMPLIQKVRLLFTGPADESDEPLLPKVRPASARPVDAKKEYSASEVAGYGDDKV